MASEGNEADRATVVAAVASRLFGTAISADAVIDESLARATDPTLKPANLGNELAAAIDAEVPNALDDNALRVHPLAPDSGHPMDQVPSAGQGVFFPQVLDRFCRKKNPPGGPGGAFAWNDCY
jgi:hypothetical protein